MAYDYDIFLSYRHRPLDSELTQKVFNAVESYRLPKSLQKQGFRNVHRAFRDTEELAVSRILTDTIDRALHSTNCLLLVCSTDTPSSEWVDREVAMFIELGRSDKIFPLLISGDPETSFPPSLKRVPDIMERVMDIRVSGNSIKKMMSKADTELLKILAAAAGCSEQELRREHALRKSRRFAAKAGFAAAVFFTVGAVSLGLMNRAQAYRDRAMAAERSSMQVLQQLTYGLPDKLTGVPGAYSKISGILQDNARQINEILLLSTDTQNAKYEVATNYQRLATAMAVLGDDSGALENQEKAVGLFTELSQAGADPALLASARNNMGQAYLSMGKYAQAAAEFEAALEIQRAIPDGDPFALVSFLDNLAYSATELGQPRAKMLYDECMDILSAQGEDAKVWLARGETAYHYGIWFYRIGEYASAEKYYTIARTDFESLYSVHDSTQNLNLLIKAVFNLGLCVSDQGRFPEAVEYYQNAIRNAELLAAENEDNTDILTTLATLYNNCGLCCNMQGDYAAADQYYRNSVEYYACIRSVSGSASDHAVYALACLNLGENAFKAGEYVQSKADFEKGLSVLEPIHMGMGSYVSSLYYAWDSYYALIHLRDFDRAVRSGVNACSLQPDNVLANMNLGYACLYAGYYDDADSRLTAVANLGQGQADTIRLDLAAQAQSGLYSAHAADLLAALPGA